MINILFLMKRKLSNSITLRRQLSETKKSLCTQTDQMGDLNRAMGFLHSTVFFSTFPAFLHSFTTFASECASNIASLIKQPLLASCADAVLYVRPSVCKATKT